MVGQGRPLKVNPVQEACPNRDNIWIFINLSQTCRSIPLPIGAVIVYFVSVLFFLFLPQLFFCIIIFCVKLFCSSTHTLSKNSVPVTEKNCLCRAACSAMPTPVAIFWGSVSARYNWACATSLLIDLATNISRSRRLNLSSFGTEQTGCSCN